jgi:anti-anti-sigma factor
MNHISKSEQHVIVINDDMDAQAARKLRSEFENAVEKDDRNVTIDINKVDFIDSSGIGALVFLFKRLTAVDRTLVIKGVHGQPRDLFEFLRIDKTISVQMAGGADQGTLGHDTLCDVR